MRSISLAVFCTLVLSCASATVSSNQEAENIRVVQSAYQNFGAGNMDALVNTFSPDVEWRIESIENVPFAGTRRGREEIRDFFTKLGQAQEVLSFEPREYIAQGDRVVVLGHSSWRVRSTGRRLKATGRWFSLSGMGRSSDSRSSPILPLLRPPIDRKPDE